MAISLAAGMGELPLAQRKVMVESCRMLLLDMETLRTER